MDYRLIALGAMFALGAYNFLIRKFFAEKEDWRFLIPVVVLAALALGVFYLTSFKEIKTTPNSWMYLIGFITIGVLAFALPYFALAQKDAQVGITVAITSLSVVVATVLGMAFLGEQITLLKAAGIVLALVSIVMLVI